MEKVLEEIKLFIRKNDWGDAKRLDENTSVEDDMGITGMDAVDFINDYAKEFNVDIKEFDYRKYFYAEGGIDLINPLLNLFKREEERINIKPKVLTLKHLEKAVIAGRLDEEVINS
jgi:acyl carrier protein